MNLFTQVRKTLITVLLGLTLTVSSLYFYNLVAFAQTTPSSPDV